MLYEWSTSSIQVIKLSLFSSWLLVLFFFGDTGVGYFVRVPQVLAQESKNPYPNFKAGHVTGIQGAEIQIDNTNYPMVTSIMITDQYENLVSLKDISQGERVLYHLDGKGRIDKLILWIPS